MILEERVKFVLISMLWGFTNPLIKRGAAGVEQIKHSSRIKQHIQKIFYLVSRLQFVGPFFLNQSGSLLYYFILRDSDLSVAVPVVNSLTFLFTGLAGWALGENPPNKRALLGMTFILGGVTCYLIDKTD